MHRIFVLACMITIALYTHAFAANDSSIATAQTMAIKAVPGLEMVKVEGGCFMMGSSESEKGHFSDESPRHEECLDDFWISRFEITNAQFRLYDSNHDSGDHEGKSLNEDMQPVVFVSWNEANTYARWLSKKTGKEFKLPTETQWEFAARAGSESVHFWGDATIQACAYANVGDQSAKSNWKNWAKWQVFNCNDGYTVSAPVGSYKANAFGLYDMLGNVWEWTREWHSDNYLEQGKSARSANGSNKSLRGGSWYSGPLNIRNARRSWFRPDSKCNSLGFRLVMTEGTN